MKEMLTFELQHPGAVWQFAEDLGTQIYVAHQIEW